MWPLCALSANVFSFPVFHAYFLIGVFICFVLIFLYFVVFTALIYYRADCKGSQSSLTVASARRMWRSVFVRSLDRCDTKRRQLWWSFSSSSLYLFIIQPNLCSFVRQKMYKECWCSFSFVFIVRFRIYKNFWLKKSNNQFTLITFLL